MTTPTNPVLHVPAHKQTNPAAKPWQLTINEPLTATAAESYRQVHDPMYQHGTRTGRFTSATSNLEEVTRNVCVQQDKEKAQ